MKLYAESATLSEISFMKKISKGIFPIVFSALTAVEILTFIFVLILANGNISVIKSVAFWILCVIVNVAVSLIISKLITKKITTPINEIDLSKRNQFELYEEITPFYHNIKKRSDKIRRQMERAKREHEIQDRVRREFTANVSHELKTPLTSISGYAEILKNGMVKPEDVTRFSEKIYSEAQRLINLVGDIIKLSRLDENAVEEKKERIELYSLCETIIGRLESAAAKRGINFELIGAKTEITGIPRIIDEMIYNLCDNAVKYNRENGKITVSVIQTTTEVVLSVSDTGIGIPKEDTERVFERFYRVNKSHSKEIGGTGLGLSIVKHGAAVHNAKLSVESELQKGTTVTITFKA